MAVRSADTASPPMSTPERRPEMAERVDVRKTYKLYIGGAFPRSESGRSYAVYAAPSRPGARPRRSWRVAASSWSPTSARQKA